MLYVINLKHKKKISLKKATIITILYLFFKIFKLNIYKVLSLKFLLNKIFLLLNKKLNQILLFFFFLFLSSKTSLAKEKLKSRFRKVKTRFWLYKGKKSFLMSSQIYRSFLVPLFFLTITLRFL